MKIIRELNNNPGIDYPNGSRFGIYTVNTDNVIIGFKGEGKYNKIEYRGVVIKKTGKGYHFGYNSRYWGSQPHRKKVFKEIETISIPTKEKLIYYSNNFRQLLIIKPESLIFIRKNHIIEVQIKPFSKGHKDFQYPDQDMYFYPQDTLKINDHLYKRVKKETIEFKIN